MRGSDHHHLDEIFFFDDIPVIPLPPLRFLKVSRKPSDKAVTRNGDNHILLGEVFQSNDVDDSPRSVFPFFFTLFFLDGQSRLTTDNVFIALEIAFNPRAGARFNSSTILTQGR